MFFLIFISKINIFYDTFGDFVCGRQHFLYGISHSLCM